MWQDNAQSHHQYVEIAGRHHRDRLSRATVGFQRSGTSMSAVHQPVLTLAGTAHGSSPRTEGALLKPAWMRDKANWLLWWRGCGVRPACHLVAVWFLWQRNLVRLIHRIL